MSSIRAPSVFSDEFNRAEAPLIPARWRLVPKRQHARRGPVSDGAISVRVLRCDNQVVFGSKSRHRRIGLVGCVKDKRSKAAMAQDLYVSTLFVGRRAYVERTCDEWFVLSALHGLVKPTQMLEPYDVTLVGAPRQRRREWADATLQQIDSQIGTLSGLEIELHAGADYRDFGLVDGLQRRGATVVVPALGLSQGRQLAFYADANRGRKHG